MTFPKSLTTVTPFSKYVALSLFIILPFATFFIGYHFGGLYNAKTVYEGIPVQSYPTPVQQTNNTNDWETVTSKACNLEAQLPPKKEPYVITDTDTIDKGKYWRFEESKAPADRELLQEYTDIVHIIMRADNEPGSGYVAGNVFIQCGENKNNATNESLVANYEKQFTNGSNNGLEIKKKENVQLWDKKVTALSMEGGMFPDGITVYFLATDKHVYQISKLGMSTNMNIKETTDKIFNGLVLKD